ncbi:MAG: AAA family ATPase [Jatrophihabitans sp.]|uniref:AAA family ATPase n=1 Tax=Jatrophihabitans sp. TaxID=1932789 RepID=UPI003F7E2C02
MRLPVLSAAEGAAWEERLLTGLPAVPGGVVIARRCVDVVDLLAVAASGQGRAALVAADLRRLDADAVDRLRSCDVAPVGVVRVGDEAAEQRLRALGIVHLLPDDAEASVAAAVIAEAVRDQATPPGTDRSYAATGSVPITGGALPPGAGAPPEAADDRTGTVVAVWGPTGAPGRTLLTVTLADELARLGRSALAVDADVYGGTIAPMLGLLDESPGVAAACRQASSAGLDGTALAALCWQLGPSLRVLTGIPLASRWPEVRPTALAAVLGAARRLADVTVVDCGFCLEADEELSFDTLAPRRNGATLAVLDDADLVLVVGSADPIGMQRLVRARAELRDAEIEAPVRVVLNRVRSGVVPGDVHTELRTALERFAGCTPTAMLPFDGRTVDAALARGRLLGEAAPGSPLRLAVVELAATLAGVPVPGRGRRRR